MDNFNILFLAGATSVVGLVAAHQLASSLQAQIKKLKINLNSLNVLCKKLSPVNQNIPFPSRSQFLSSDCNVLSVNFRVDSTTLIYLHKSSSKNIPQIECYLNQSIIKLYMTIKPNNCLVAGKIIFNLSCMTYLLAPASTRLEATMTREAPRRNRVRDVCMSLRRLVEQSPVFGGIHIYTHRQTHTLSPFY